MWILKFIIKILISKLNIPYNILKKIGVFVHGSMDIDDYALKIFNLHYERIRNYIDVKNSVLLEIGPGDSISSTIIANSYGAKKIYLVDIGNFAHKNIHKYKKLSILLNAKNLKKTDISSVSSIEEILKLTNSEYLTKGIDDLKKIPSNSIDYIWSHSVLEHIKKNEFEDTIENIYRILKKGGVTSHNIDYKDHLSGGLNNLLFPDRIWESNTIYKSGFYTNRIPAIKIHEVFKKKGFIILDQKFSPWPIFPIKRHKIDISFKNYTNEELNNRTSYLIAQKK